MSEQLEEPAIEAEPVAPAEEAPGPESEPVAAEPAYDPTEDPRIYDLVQAQAAQIADQQIRGLLAQAQAATAQQNGATAPVFFDEDGNFIPESFAAFQAQRDEQIAARFEQALLQVAQPIQEQQQAAAVAEGEKQMLDVIADLASREGELVGGDLAVQRVIEDVKNRWFPQMSARYGLTNRAAELAIEKAFRAERDYQKAISAASEQQRVNRNASLAGVRGEPGLGAGSGVPASPAEPYAKGALALKYSQQAHQIRSA